MSRANAWTSFAAITQPALQPGDVVLIYPGTYDERYVIARSGTELGGRITYQGVTEAGVRPTLRGIDGNNDDYIAVIGLRFSHTSFAAHNFAAIELNGADGWLIQDNIFEDTTSGGIFARVSNPSSNNVVRANIFSNITGINGGTTATTTSSAVIQFTGHGNLIEYNAIYESLDRTRAFGEGNVIRNNYFGPTDAIDYPNTSPYPHHTDSFQSYVSTQVLSKLMYERNWDEDNADSVGGTNAHGFLIQDETGAGMEWAIARFNVLLRPGGSAYQLQSFTRFYGYNLTSIGIQDGASGPQRSAVTYDNPTDPDDTGPLPPIPNNIQDWRNNTWSFSPNTIDHSGIITSHNRGTGFTSDRQHAYNAGTTGTLPTPLTANLAVVDPLFTDPTEGVDDYTLQAVSPLRNQGAAITAAVGGGTNSATLVVVDSRRLFDGWGVADGDLIKIGSAGSYVRIDAIDYSTNTITLGATRSWSDGDGVWVKGSEDVGALPFSYTTPFSIINTTPATPAGGADNLTATVLNTDAVRMVQFLVDGVPVGIDFDPDLDGEYAVTWAAADGQPHDVQARAYNAWASRDLLWAEALNGVPYFTTQPLTQAVELGDDLTLTVAVEGDPAPTLQWQKDGVDVSEPNASGTTTTSLVITNFGVGNVGSYTVVATSSRGTATSSPAIIVSGSGTPVTISGVSAVDKTYDGTDDASLSTTDATLVGVLGGHDVQLVTTGATATFTAGADVGLTKAVEASGFSLGGADAGLYVVVQPLALTANILPKAVTPSVSVQDKVYDRTTTGTISGRSLAGTVIGDDVTLSGGTATFNSASVGADKQVNVTGLSLGGTDAANYQLSSTSAITTADVTVATVTPTVTVADKVYDGSTSATISSRTLAGVLGADVVTLTGGTAAFATATAGVNKPVNVTALSLSGTHAANYQLSSTSVATTASISKAVAAIQITNLVQIVDGSPKPVTVTTLPPGLTTTVTYDPGPGAPSAQGEYDVSVEIVDANYTGSATATYYLNDPTAPTITSELAVVAIQDEPFNYTITAANDPTGFGYTGTLPAGLTFDNDAGTISGMPTTTGAYEIGILASNGGGTDARDLEILVATMPTFTGQPEDRSIYAGNNTSFSVTVAGEPAPDLQWQVSTNEGDTWTNVANGGIYSGATSGTLTLTGAETSHTGNWYRAMATNAAGSLASDSALLTVAEAIESRLSNISILATAGTDGNTLISGFIVRGPAERTLLVRGIGPSLAEFDVSNPVSNPNLTLFAGDSPVSSNDDWEESADADAIAEASETVVVPFNLNALESALLPDVSGEGENTVHLVGPASGGAAALVQVFDVGGDDDTRLVNGSGRSHVGTGENVLVLGFEISGTTPREILIRAVGPSLSGFAVPGVLANPRLRLYAGEDIEAEPIEENDDWDGAEAISDAASAVGAFAFTSSTSEDSALLVTLDPGTYTAVLSGVDDGTGVALLELYEVE